MAWTDSTNLKKTLTLTIAAGGTGYAVGDVLTIVQSGASGGTATVTTVNAGVVTAISFLTAGIGYYVANTLATTVAPAGGADCTLNITAVNYIGATGKAKKYVYYIQYTKGGETAATLSIGFMKNNLSTSINYVSSPVDIAAIAQQVFTITGTQNVTIPVTIPKCIDSIIASLNGTIATPTGTIVINGYPDLLQA